MKQQDLVKVVIAAICLIGAAAVLAWQFNLFGGSSNEAGGETRQGVDVAEVETIEDLPDEVVESATIIEGGPAGKPQRKMR